MRRKTTTSRSSPSTPRHPRGWLEHAEVDGTQQAVQTTVLSESKETESESGEFESTVERRLAFSYPRGDVILHDPQTELRTSSAEVEQDTPGPGFALVAVAFLATAFLRRRR